MSTIRSAGFWIINLNSAVSSYLYQCINCRKLRRNDESQKMSDLPLEQTDPSPPFSYVGVDYFEPFQVNDGRRYCKKYGVIFTCLYRKAVHEEVRDDLSSDAFFHCLRTFVSLRGAVRTIFCDQVTNLVGGFNELEANLSSIKDASLHAFS